MLQTAERHAVLLLVIALATLVAAPASSEPLEEAKQHYQRGDEHFKRGDYAAAIVEFEMANRLVPSPVLFYNIGLCHEQLGNTVEAVAEYRAYLREVPNASNHAAVSARVRSLEAELAAAREPTGTSTPAATPPPPPPTPEAQAPAADSGATDYAGNDPDLRRAAEIDVAAVGSQYRGWGQPGPASQSASAVPTQPSVPPPAAPPAGASATNQPPAPSEYGPASPPPDGSSKEATPFYKKWWFWVAAGVGALIIINIAVDDDNNDSTRATSLTVGSPAAAVGDGPLLWRF